MGLVGAENEDISLLDGALWQQHPLTWHLLVVLAWTVLLVGMLGRQSSRVFTSTEQWVRALLKEMEITKTRFSFCLWEQGCGFSVMTEMTSAEMMLGFWSPSFSKVIRVPCLQPGFTSIRVPCLQALPHS